MRMPGSLREEGSSTKIMWMLLVVLSHLPAEARPLPAPDQIERIFWFYRLFRFLTLGLCVALAGLLVYVVVLTAQGRIFDSSSMSVDAGKTSGSRRQGSDDATAKGRAK